MYISLNSLFCLKNELNIVADGIDTLNTFCAYQQTVNPSGDDNPLHFDYAILITGYEYNIIIVDYNLRFKMQLIKYSYVLLW